MVGRNIGFIKDRDIWDADFGGSDIDRDLTIKFSHKHRGSVRLSTGKFYTRKEFKSKKERVMETPLP
ncbi:MAG: hypothetical protein R6U44_05820 [Archaeoglobaceae archaeon]